MTAIDKIIIHLQLFSSQIIDLCEPASKVNILVAETSIGVALPDDYRTFVKKYNGFTLMGIEVYGVGDVNRFSLEQASQVEHNEVGNPMPHHLIPFSPDGLGNHYCFDMNSRTEESSQVVFWQHDYPYSDSDAPESTNDSFAAWLGEVAIDWTLKDYDYDGNKK